MTTSAPASQDNGTVAECGVAVTSEKDQAIALANKVLDTPYRDPDDDLSMMSRQFLRALERETTADHALAALRDQVAELETERTLYDTPAWEANDQLNKQVHIARYAFERIIEEGKSSFSAQPYAAIAQKALDEMASVINIADLARAALRARKESE